MKQLASILLLFLLLFNFVGYRFVFNVLQQKANKETIAKLDKHQYTDADLITLTIPLSMPYLTDTKDFESKAGEIIIKGKVYHYVKQKISQGNLVLKCLPDEQQTQLQNARVEFFKLANELQNSTSNNTGHSSQVIKIIISDYLKTDNNISAVAVNYPSTNFCENYFALLQKGQTSIPEQPPRA